MANNDDLDLATLSLTYTLIYQFLIDAQTEHSKAAKALRKAAKTLVDVKKAPAPSESLMSIIRQWRVKGENKVEESSEEEDSSDEDDEPVKALPAKAQAAAAAVSDSSDSDSSPPPKPAPAPEPIVAPTPPSKPSKKRKRQSEPLPNGHGNGHAPSTPGPSTNGTVAPNGTPAAPLSGALAVPATEPRKKKARKEAALLHSSPVKQQDIEMEAEPEKETEQDPSPEPTKSKAPRKPIVPFSRIKPEDVHFADERLKDNTFESRGAGGNDYGVRASRDLIVTRGAGFRKEKNKKKRGSYVGGEITMKSHSIKFDD